jgi:hypothetical protein
MNKDEVFNFKTYYKNYINQDREEPVQDNAQINRIKSTEVTPHIFDQLVSDKYVNTRLQQRLLEHAKE